MKESEDRKELEKLRVSLARIAQALSVQSIILPVLVRKDFGAISKLARDQNRGWNALSACVLNKLKRMSENNLYAVRAVSDLAIEYLNDNTRTLKDVEDLLLSVSAIIPNGARKTYQHAVFALSQPPDDAYADAKVHLKSVRQWAEDALGGLNG